MRIVLFASFLCYMPLSYGMDQSTFEAKMREGYNLMEKGRLMLAEAMLSNPNFSNQMRHDLQVLSLSELNKQETDYLKVIDRISKGESVNLVIESQYAGTVLPIIQEAQQIKRRQWYIKLACGAGIAVLALACYILYSRSKNDTEETINNPQIQQSSSSVTKP